MESNEALEYPGCQVLGELKGGDYIQDDSQVTNQDTRETEKGCESW